MRKYTVEYLAQDKRFREWVLSDDTEAEEYWVRWVADHPDQLPVIQEAREIVRSIRFRDYSLSSGEKSRIWGRIERKTGVSAHKSASIHYMHGKPVKEIQQDKAGTENQERHQKSGWHRGLIQKVRTAPGRDRVLLKLAAAALVLIALGLGILKSGLPWLDDTVVYRTDYGQVSEFLLQDGSTVVLNANTELRVNSGWSRADIREVWLNGEAYFDVVQTESGQPFVVRAGNINVHVLGTSFNAYTRNNKAHFELASGRVELENRITRTDVRMNPGDQVVYNDLSMDPIHRKINTNEVAAWRDQLLIFRRTSLDEIGELLTNNYGLDVVFEDEQISQQYFTGTIPSNDVDRLLATLSKAFDLKIQRKDRTVIIQKDGEGQ